MTDLISIFDRKRLIRHRRRAAATFSDHDFLFQETAARLRERLKDIDRDFHASLELGAHYPVLGNKASITVDIDPTLGKGKKLFASMAEHTVKRTYGSSILWGAELCAPHGN